MKAHKILYTTKEAAEILPYKNAASVKARINEGKIKAEKVGRDWFITATEIQRLLDESNARRNTKIKDNFPCLSKS